MLESPFFMEISKARAFLTLERGPEIQNFSSASGLCSVAEQSRPGLLLSLSQRDTDISCIPSEVCKHGS